MKFQRKKVATALAYALGLSGTVLLGNAYGADIKVDVTGTNIPRVEAEGALPVTVYTREDISRTGATSAQELLQYITANTSVNSFNSTTVIGATTFSLQSDASWRRWWPSCSRSSMAFNSSVDVFDFGRTEESNAGLALVSERPRNYHGCGPRRSGGRGG